MSSVRNVMLLPLPATTAPETVSRLLVVVSATLPVAETLPVSSKVLAWESSAKLPDEALPVTLATSSLAPAVCEMPVPLRSRRPASPWPTPRSSTSPASVMAPAVVALPSLPIRSSPPPVLMALSSAVPRYSLAPPSVMAVVAVLGKTLTVPPPGALRLPVSAMSSARSVMLRPLPAESAPSSASAVALLRNERSRAAAIPPAASMVLPALSSRKSPLVVAPVRRSTLSAVPLAWVTLLPRRSKLRDRPARRRLASAAMLTAPVPLACSETVGAAMAATCATFSSREPLVALPPSWMPVLPESGRSVAVVKAPTLPARSMLSAVALNAPAVEDRVAPLAMVTPGAVRARSPALVRAERSELKRPPSETASGRTATSTALV